MKKINKISKWMTATALVLGMAPSLLAQSFMPKNAQPVIRTEEVTLDSGQASTYAYRLQKPTVEQANVSVFAYYDKTAGKVYVDIRPEKGYKLATFCNESNLGVLLPRDLEVLDVKQAGIRDGKNLEVGENLVCRVAADTIENVLNKVVTLKPKTNLAVEVTDDLIDSMKQVVKDNEQKAAARATRLMDLKSPDSHLETIVNYVTNNPKEWATDESNYAIRIGPQEGITPKPNPKIYVLLNLRLMKQDKLGGEFDYWLVPVEERDEKDLTRFLMSSRELPPGTHFYVPDQKFSESMQKKLGLEKNPGYSANNQLMEHFGADRAFFAYYNFKDALVAMSAIHLQDGKEDSEKSKLFVDESKSYTVNGEQRANPSTVAIFKQGPDYIAFGVVEPSLVTSIPQASRREIFDAVEEFRRARRMDPVYVNRDFLKEAEKPKNDIMSIPGILPLHD